jgi:GTP cyclohydrolase I
VNFDEPNEYLPESSIGAKIDGSNCRERYQIRHGEIDVEGYNEGATTTTPLATNRAQSPYTQHPTIDFDNLSWPSG